MTSPSLNEFLVILKVNSVVLLAQQNKVGMLNLDETSPGTESIEPKFKSN